MDGSVTAIVTDPSTALLTPALPLSHCTERYRERREEPASSNDAGLFTCDRSVIGRSDHVVNGRYQRQFTAIRHGHSRVRAPGGARESDSGRT